MPPAFYVFSGILQNALQALWGCIEWVVHLAAMPRLFFWCVATVCNHLLVGSLPAFGLPAGRDMALLRRGPGLFPCLGERPGFLKRGWAYKMEKVPMAASGGPQKM